MKGYFRKRGDKWSFTIDIGRDPETNKRKQKTVSGFKTKKEAVKACAEMITQIENGQYNEKSKVTIEQFLIDFMENVVKPSVQITTYNTQMNIVKNHIIPDLGKKKMEELNPITVQKLYMKKIDNGLSSSYIKLMHAILGKAYRKAMEWGIVQKNVIQLVTPPRVEHKDITVWTLDEAKRFLDHSQKRKFFIGYVLAIYTGMRRGEIIGLRWSDINLENNTLSIKQTLTYSNGKGYFKEPKTKGSKRTITIPEYAVQCLKKHKAKQNEYRLKLGEAYEDHDLVVCSWNGQPINPTDINKDFTMAIKLSGVPQIRFHDLRHTHATILLQMGENPKVVSERLGHSEVGITLDTYSHVLPNMQKELANNFDLTMKQTKKSL